MAYKAKPKEKPRRKQPGRIALLRDLTPHEARQEAEQRVRTRSYSEAQRGAIQLLGACGVVRLDLFRRRLKLAERTVRKYRTLRLIDLVELPQALNTLFQDDLHQAVVLGPVGLALAEMEERMVPRGYLSSPQDRISHDLLCSLVCLRLMDAFLQQGHEVILHGRYTATVLDDEGRPVLEPDALLEVKAAQGPRHLFVVEYHHEDYGGRAMGKVSKYEEIWWHHDHGRRWCRRAWRATQMPTVLVAWTHRAVGTGYHEAIQTRKAGRGLENTYLGKPLSSFLAGDPPLLWRDFGEQREHILLG